MIVPWSIAIYGLSYHKSLKLDVIKQQIMAIVPLLGLLTNCKAAAEEYPVGFIDTAKRVKAAAGILCYPCYSRSNAHTDPLFSTERAMRNHRIDMRNTLISLFETPVPETDLVGREVLTRVLAVKPSDFEKPLIDIATNVHLQALIRPGVPPIVWETKERHNSRARTVLDPVATSGQRLLLEFLGTYFVYLSSY
jgi:hypothetical protein